MKPVTTAVIPMTAPVLGVVCAMSAESKTNNNYYTDNDKLMRPGIGQNTFCAVGDCIRSRPIF